MKQYLLPFLNMLAIIVAYLFGCLCHNSMFCSVPASSSVSSDTVFIIRHDTLRDTIPHLVRERIISTDTIYVSVPSADSAVSDASVPVILPRIQRQYTSSSYTAYVSGCCDPRLDSINIFSDIVERTVTIHPEAKRWGLALQAGATYDFSSHRPQPYIGIGISYNFLTW